MHSIARLIVCCWAVTDVVIDIRICIGDANQGFII
jgi:hypothetical protein